MARIDLPGSTSSPIAHAASLKWTLLAIACVHGLLLIYDIATGFAPFLRGDRSFDRLQGMQEVIDAGFASGFSVLVTGPVHPGEYILQLPLYVLTGPLGVIIFQVALALLSAVCLWKLVERTISHPWAPPIVTLLYALAPMTLTFSHQFTTEAVATPFCIFFLFWTVRALSTKTVGDTVVAGLCLGAVILLRPGYAVIVPALVALGGVLALAGTFKSLGRLTAVCVVAILPLAAWMTVYTTTTGQFGYTSGVATVDWNLRSKVYFVERANGREGPPEVAHITDYDDLWNPPESSGGISLGRYLAIASEHPVDYLQAAAVDGALTFLRGGFSKLAVDYLGIGRDTGIKEWRDVYDTGGLPAMFQWAGQNLDILAAAVLEAISSVIAALMFLVALGFAIYAVFRPHHTSRSIGPSGFTLTILAICVAATAAVSVLIVDRAQPRLRNPADPAIILLVALAVQSALPAIIAGKASSPAGGPAANAGVARTTLRRRALADGAP